MDNNVNGVNNTVNTNVTPTPVSPTPVGQTVSTTPVQPQAAQPVQPQPVVQPTNRVITGINTVDIGNQPPAAQEQALVPKKKDNKKSIIILVVGLLVLIGVVFYQFGLPLLNNDKAKEEERLAATSFISDFVKFNTAGQNKILTSRFVGKEITDPSYEVTSLATSTKYSCYVYNLDDLELTISSSNNYYGTLAYCTDEAGNSEVLTTLTSDKFNTGGFINYTKEGTPKVDSLKKGTDSSTSIYVKKEMSEKDITKLTSVLSLKLS